jgi:anthranilate synthase component 1
MVPSRRFQQKFIGDDFNVYRALRAINPSPYLFYFDFEDFHLMGSSPETQIRIKDNMAHIDPIAGTVKRTGDPIIDEQSKIELLADEKENAEHVMLVDLARNDLSRNAREVELVKYKEIQSFSHVMHIVSHVQGKLKQDTNPIRVFGDTFPAGTLSGAPKFKAMELIDSYEPTSRNFYGGSIGFIGFNGNINHAIFIRSFLSKDHTLYYQAGAGIVASSVPRKELEEVNNKLRALTKAITLAEKIIR